MSSSTTVSSSSVLADIPAYSFYDSSSSSSSSSSSFNPSSSSSSSSSSSFNPSSSSASSSAYPSSSFNPSSNPYAPSPSPSARSPSPFSHSNSESTQPLSNAESSSSSSHHNSSGWESMSSPSSPGSGFDSSPRHFSGGEEYHVAMGNKKVVKRTRKVKTVDEKVERKLKKQNHVCKWDNCQEEFPDSAQLRDHLEGHIGRGLSVYNCKWEGCGFGERKKRDHMKSHIRKHHQFVGFYCSTCGEGFVRDQELRKHLCTGAEGSTADNESCSPQDSRSGSSSYSNQPFQTAGDTNVVVPAPVIYYPQQHHHPGQQGQPGGFHAAPNRQFQQQQQQHFQQQQYHRLQQQQQQHHRAAPSAPAHVAVRAPVHFLPTPNGGHPSGSLGNRPGAPYASAKMPPSPAHGQAARGAGAPGRTDQQLAGSAYPGGFHSPEHTVSDLSSSEYSSPYAVPGSPYSASSPEGYPAASYGYQSQPSHKRPRNADDDLDAWFSSLSSTTAVATVPVSLQASSSSNNGSNNSSPNGGNSSNNNNNNGQQQQQPFTPEFVQGLNTLITKFEDEPSSFDKYATTIAQCYPYFKKVKQCIEEAHLEPTQEVDDLFDFNNDYYPIPVAPQELDPYAADLMNTHHVWDQSGGVVIEERVVTMDRLISTVPQTFSPQVVRFGGQVQDEDEDEDEEDDDQQVGGANEEEEDTVTDEDDSDYVTDSEDEGEEVANQLGQMSLKPKKHRTVKDFLEILDTLLLLGESSQPSS